MHRRYIHILYLFFSKVIWQRVNKRQKKDTSILEFLAPVGHLGFNYYKLRQWYVVDCTTMLSNSLKVINPILNTRKKPSVS